MNKEQEEQFDKHNGKVYDGFMPIKTAKELTNKCLAEQAKEIIKIAKSFNIKQ